jgi:hypothetical protein
MALAVGVFLINKLSAQASIQYSSIYFTTGHLNVDSS